MSDEKDITRSNPVGSTNRAKHGGPATGYRIVHVSVPENVFNHAKAQAYLSGIPWPKFVEKLLAESVPNKT